MARKKLIPTWVKVAALAALFVPYKVDIDKDDDKKLKRITTNSVAVRLSYSPARDGKESDFSAVIPGITAGKCKVKAGGKTYSVDGEQLIENAKLVCEEVAGKVKCFAKKAADGVISVVEDEAKPEEADDIIQLTEEEEEEEKKVFAE